MNSDFFDYEKNLSNLLNNQNKIEVYTSPNKKYVRKKSEDEKSYQYTFDRGKLFNNQNYEGRRRGNSQRIKRNNNNTELITNDNGHKDEISTNRRIYSNKYINRLAIKSGKSLNRFKRKKVTFKNPLVSNIEIESYKKYYFNDHLYENADAKCACIIY